MGWKVTLTISCPARVSSTKPTMAATEVFFMSWTRKPTVGGMAMRPACGRMTQRSVVQRGRARAEAASHWVFGMASMAPRQMSPRKAGGVEGEGEGDGGPGVEADAGEDGEAVEGDEELHEQWRALQQADIGGCGPAERAVGRDAQEGDDEAAESAADEGDQGEQDGPAEGAQEEDQLLRAEVAAHARAPSAGRPRTKAAQKATSSVTRAAAAMAR